MENKISAALSKPNENECVFSKWNENMRKIC